MGYKEDVQSALDLTEGAPIAVIYRSIPLAPQPMGGVLRASTLGTFVKWEGECIVYKSFDAALLVDPIADVYISRPSDEEFAEIKKERERAKAAAKSGLSVPPSGGMPPGFGR